MSHSLKRCEVCRRRVMASEWDDGVCTECRAQLDAASGIDDEDDE